MIRFAHIAIAATALVAAMPAQATDFLINTNAGTSSGNTAGNSILYTVTSSDKKTLNVTASAWAHNYPGDVYATARVGTFDPYGLGVYQSNFTFNGKTYSETATNAAHQIDNAMGWEYIVLQFDQAVSLQSATLTAFKYGTNNYVDTDAFVAWGTLGAGASVTGDFIRSLENGSNNFNSDSTKYTSTKFGSLSDADYRESQVQNYNLSPDKAGNVWIIGASKSGPDNNNDAFKLNAIKVTSGVPEPMTWMTMILGFGVIGAALRRRRTADKAALA